MGNRKRKITLIGVLALGALTAGGVALGLLDHGRSGPPQQDMAIDKAQREEVIANIIANLNQHYVYPEKAAQIERQLHAQAQRGDFDGVTSAEQLADTLTDALQRIGHDKHLAVRYFEKPVAELAPGEDASPEQNAAELAEQQRFNFGFSSVERLRGNIGYLDVHEFGRPQRAAERIAAAMTLLGDTAALIVDLRHCDGGDPDTVMQFASYLFERRTHLNDIYWRDEDRTEERWTQEAVPGKKYGEARKIYVLTSEETFSAGEDFAYALKNAGRATLVGETTGGGAHPGDPRRLTAHFMMFVPSGRTINPVTHTDWEGVGVAPDVKTSAKNALDVAQVAVLKQLIVAETDAAWKAKLQRRLADLE